MPSNHLILYCPLLLPHSVFPIFSNESALCISWPKYWSFSLSISASNEYTGLISCRMDWLDLLAVQGTLKSLLQHHSSKASVLRSSAFFLVQLSHSYIINLIPVVLGSMCLWAVYSNLLPLVRGFSICRTARKTWLRILSIALEEKLKVLEII